MVKNYQKKLEDQRRFCQLEKQLDLYQFIAMCFHWESDVIPCIKDKNQTYLCMRECVCDLEHVTMLIVRIRTQSLDRPIEARIVFTQILETYVGIVTNTVRLANDPIEAG